MRYYDFNKEMNYFIFFHDKVVLLHSLSLHRVQYV